MIIRESDRIQKLQSMLDIDFMTKLKEVVKLHGSDVVDTGVVSFVSNLFVMCGYESSELEPYEVVDDISGFTSEKRPGKIVSHIDGRKGRTYNDTQVINGKIPVYFSKNEKNGIPVEYAGIALLVEPGKLNVIGYID